MVWKSKLVPASWKSLLLFRRFSTGGSSNSTILWSKWIVTGCVHIVRVRMNREMEKGRENAKSNFRRTLCPSKDVKEMRKHLERTSPAFPSRQPVQAWGSGGTDWNVLLIPSYRRFHERIFVHNILIFWLDDLLSAIAYKNSSPNCSREMSIKQVRKKLLIPNPSYGPHLVIKHVFLKVMEKYIGMWWKTEQA